MPTRRESFEKIGFAENANPGLWLDKFIEDQDESNNNHDKNKAEKFKSKLVNQTATIKISQDYQHFFTRRMENLAQIEPHIFKAIEINSRMICGLGASSVWENAITIHRTYGVPFIPGSSLKGLAASYAHKYLDKKWQKETWENGVKKTELGEYHEFVFGSQISAGFVTFHDALILPKSTEKQFLHADIMTVHHPEYYGDKGKPPADWDSPIPINFISASGKYLLTLTTVEGGENWLDLTAQILEKAFKTEGIGAKTSSGYGRAVLTEDFKKTPEMQRKEEERKERIRAEAEAEQKRLELKAELEKAELQRQKEIAQELKNQAAQAEKQEQEISRFTGIASQIAALTANAKKLEKEFDRIRERIHKIENAQQKRELAAAAIAKVEQLQNEGAKIDVSGKWFGTLNKMKGGN